MRLIQILFNYTPHFKGKLRIARFLVLRKNKQVTFITPNRILYTVPNLIENVSFELFINGIYEKKTLEFICSSIPKNGVFVDVGANIGAICIEVARVRPDVKVYAFEASPRVFEYLAKNINQNGILNIEIFNLAIHDQGGLELPFFSPVDLNGKGSFSPIFTKKSETVRTIRLDDFFNSQIITPNFIKVDVEGFEMLIFKSLSNVHLKDCILFFEFVDWAESAANFKVGEAQKYLLDMGFKLKRFSNNEILKNQLMRGADMIVAEL
jgi:FkbM family methyltransferase